jgi:hypothetical protein
MVKPCMSVLSKMSFWIVVLLPLLRRKLSLIAYIFDNISSNSIYDNI